MALVLLNPHIPMLFMGEEAAVDTPFLFFADWTGEAAELTREGAAHGVFAFQGFLDTRNARQNSNPCDERTFQASKLDWSSIDRSPSCACFRALTAQLLQIRREKIVPLIERGFVTAQRELLGDDPRQGGVHVRWQTERERFCRSSPTLRANDCLCPQLVEGECLWRGGPADEQTLLPGDIIVRLGRTRPRVELAARTCQLQSSVQTG